MQFIIEQSNVNNKSINKPASPSNSVQVCRCPPACRSWRQCWRARCPSHGQTGWWRPESSSGNPWTVGTWWWNGVRTDKLTVNKVKPIHTAISNEMLASVWSEGSIGINITWSKIPKKESIHYLESLSSWLMPLWMAMAGKFCSISNWASATHRCTDLTKITTLKSKHKKQVKLTLKWG